MDGVAPRRQRGPEPFEKPRRQSLKKQETAIGCFHPSACEHHPPAGSVKQRSNTFPPDADCQRVVEERRRGFMPVASVSVRSSLPVNEFFTVVRLGIGHLAKQRPALRRAAATARPPSFVPPKSIATRGRQLSSSRPGSINPATA
jgi:hypothetical protein